MIQHPTVDVLFVSKKAPARLQSWIAYLQSMRHVKLTIVNRVPPELGPYNVIVTQNCAAHADHIAGLTQFVRAGGSWLELMDLAETPLPDIFGAQPGLIGPAAELRVFFENSSQPLAARLPDNFYVGGRYHALEKTTADGDVILCADWHYGHRPVLVHRRVDRGQVACTTLQDYNHAVVQQIFYRLLRHLAGQTSAHTSLGVGLLGYAPSIGQVHAMGARQTVGLDLRAVCDVDPQRRNQALQDFPQIKLCASAAELADRADIDLVIVATPPHTHAQLCLQMMSAGKHVVCEKPLALRRHETDEMVEMSEIKGVHLSCHQNRRWDADYVAIRQAVVDGLIGDLFYMETFVGGFTHPCGYWHSHAEISGGTAYDWGAHYLDWMVSLIPSRVHAVIGTRHQRVWHDVTNADQERIQIRFADGQEAEFIHSDIAAVRKPKWYILGTEGAISGHWRDVTAYAIDPVLYFHPHAIPATELTPELKLYRRHRSGHIITQDLAIPAREHFCFHRNLADHLLTGEPIGAPLEDSVLVVRILEAAACSAQKGGTVEVLDG